MNPEAIELQAIEAVENQERMARAAEVRRERNRLALQQSMREQRESSKRKPPSDPTFEAACEKLRESGERLGWPEELTHAINPRTMYGILRCEVTGFTIALNDLSLGPPLISDGYPRDLYLKWIRSTVGAALPDQFPGLRLLDPSVEDLRNHLADQ